MEKNNPTFFKGFDKNMQCRGFQYVEGETVKENQYYRLSGGDLVEVND